MLDVVAAVASPTFSVQLRDRTDREDDELVPFAQELRKVTARRGARFIVNRRLKLARRVAADGVHVPITDLRAAADHPWRSAPAHSDEDVRAAVTAGATALLVSPIFETPGKVARGLSALRSARLMAPELELSALGGIDGRNARACYLAGADGVAVMRALLDADDPVAVAKCLAGPDTS